MRKHAGKGFRIFVALFMGISLLILGSLRAAALEQALLNSDDAAVFYEECMDMKIAFTPRVEGFPVWLNLASVSLDGASAPRCSQPETDESSEISALLESASGRLVQIRFLMNPDGVQGAVLLEMRPGDEFAIPMNFKLAFQARDGERFYGFDEKRNAWDMRGAKVKFTVLNRSDPGEDVPVNTPDRSSLIVPLILSSRGYGVWLGGGDSAEFDMDSNRHGEWALEAKSAHMRIYFLAGPDLSQVLERFNRVSGQPALTPDLSSITE